jgi:hypothetical protein
MDEFRLVRALSNDAGLHELETALEEILIPIEPRPEFVKNLSSVFQIPEENGYRKAVKYSAIGFAGFLSSIVLIATSIQAAIALIGTIKVLRQARLDIQKDTAML